MTVQHLKLDKLVTKNENGIKIQIYTCIIAYLILRLLEIPKEFGTKMLDKLQGTSKNTNLIENGHEIPVVSGSSDSQ